MQLFDYAVIGAGPGGYVSAIRAAQLGFNTVLIEKDQNMGGTCLNVGCIPSKALLESSELYHQTKHKLAEHGVITSEVAIDLHAMMQRKDNIVNSLCKGIQMLVEKNKISLLKGCGRITAPGKIAVEYGYQTTEIEAKSIVLATGSAPVELPFMKFDSDVVSSTEALCFDKIPEHLIVIGGGAIGLELGSVWNRLGAKVSVVEMLPQIVPFADKQMATLLQRSLKKQGLEFYLSARAKKMHRQGEVLILTLEDKKGKEVQLKGDKILVAVGRRPNIKFAGIQELGIKTKNNCVEVDERFCTNLPGLYAIGDLIRGPMLAHKAEEEGMAVAEIIAGKAGHVNYQSIPNVVYTWPELASVGLSEEEAKKHHEICNGKFYFRGNGRALTMGETEGMVKIIADAKSDRLLGVHILGPRASDMIAEIVMAFEFSASAEDVARTVHAHPTLSEVIKEAALAVVRSRNE